MTNNTVSPIILFCNPRHLCSPTARNQSFLQISSFNSQLLSIRLPPWRLLGTRPSASALQRSIKVLTVALTNSKHLTTLRSCVEVRQLVHGLKRILYRWFQRHQWCQESTQKWVPNGFKRCYLPTRTNSLIMGNQLLKHTDTPSRITRPRCLSPTRPLSLLATVEQLSALWARLLSHPHFSASLKIKSELHYECRPRPLKSLDLKNQIPLN